MSSGVFGHSKKPFETTPSCQLLTTSQLHSNYHACRHFGIFHANCRWLQHSASNQNYHEEVYAAASSATIAGNLQQPLADMFPLQLVADSCPIWHCKWGCRRWERGVALLQRQKLSKKQPLCVYNQFTLPGVHRSVCCSWGAQCAHKVFLSCCISLSGTAAASFRCVAQAAIFRSLTHC